MEISVGVVNLSLSSGSIPDGSDPPARLQCSFDKKRNKSVSMDYTIKDSIDKCIWVGSVGWVAFSDHDFIDREKK